MKRKIALALCAMVTTMTAMAQSNEIAMEIESLMDEWGENVAVEIYHTPKRT